jgi:hypothetical protein
MSEYTIKTLENGNVQVDRTYWSFDREETSSETYAEIGAYVYKVYPNGANCHACEGLAVRGPTLHASRDGNLEAVIRKTLGLKNA